MKKLCIILCVFLLCISVIATAEEIVSDVHTEDVEIIEPVERWVTIDSSLDGVSSVLSGTEVTLTAVLHDFLESDEYDVQWQRSTDRSNWDNIGSNSLTYSFNISAENVNDYWRVIIRLR